MAIILFSIIPVYGQQFEVLVYTSPDRWHDPTVPVAIKAFEKMSEQHDFGHELVVTSDKDGPDSVLERELLDADVVISQPFWPPRMRQPVQRRVTFFHADEQNI